MAIFRFEPDSPRCAVKDCIAPAHPRTCPPDGKRHAHGCTHYRDFAPSDLPLREGWHFLCNRHFDQIFDPNRWPMLEGKTGSR